jgi:nucleotide-binding universal stress UspA family protein
MYQHILVPTDGSKLSANAVAEGIRLARALGAHLTFLTVITPFASLGELDHAFGGMPDSFRRQGLAFLEGEAREALATALSSAKSAGVAAETLFVESGHPHEAIIAAAKSKGADLILMASHGRSGVKAVLLGSVTQKVLAHTQLPVLVCR